MNNIERVQKLLSNYGNLSRRQADKLIEEGKVKVNGKIISLGTKATVNDRIEVNNKVIKFNLKHEYFLLNKPKGYICSREDKLGKEVISLVVNYKDRNLFTVGRLDVNTTGLIIITTNGDLADRIMKPKHEIRKTYLVWVDKVIDKEIIISLQKGTKLDDGYVTQPLKKIKVIHNVSGKILVKITITEGKKNQIRRMFEAHGRKVVNLKRVKIGNLTIDGLMVGQYKRLTHNQIHEGLGFQNQ